MTLHKESVAVVAPAGRPVIDAEAAAEGWRNALAELEYAERHGSTAAEIEQFANGVVKAQAYLRTIVLP